MPSRPVRRLLVSALALAALPAAAVAAEGMWQPAQLPAIAERLTQAGLEIDPKGLADLTQYPMNAVVSLGGCTASFVSPKGLVTTNHHCAYGSIQFNSTAERNLLTDGFVAKTLGEELRAEPSARIFVTESITDVTSTVLKGLDDSVRGVERYSRIDERTKALVADCEKTAGYRCDVYVFHGGARFNLVKQLEIRDVRLVYAPAEAIGKFGGDVDNWIWPRHTGDFAFYRAYVGPDGKPADYSELNVPYTPKAFLKVSDQGVDEGSFVMVAGYPGRTNRYRTSAEIASAIEWSYPQLIERFGAVLAEIERTTKGRPEAAVKYAATVASLNNTLKNAEGHRDGFARIDAVGMKRANEQAVLDWSKQANAGEAADAFSALDAHLATIRATRERDALLGQLGLIGAPGGNPVPVGASNVLNTARLLLRASIERALPDAQRAYGLQDRDQRVLEGRLRQLDQRLDLAVDRAIVELLLGRYLALPTEQRIPELDRWIAGGDGTADAAALKTRLDALYAGTKITDVNQRLTWFAADRKTLEAETDPALAFAQALMPAMLRIEAEHKALLGNEYLLRPQWMEQHLARAEATKTAIYPDANSSLRVTFGNVMGVSPRDAVSNAALTYGEGILEKHTGADPFDATAEQVEALKAKRFGRYADKDGRLPVNFLADLDITGGNSGSPVLNARGELVGLAFDGNYEAISSGWIFNPKLTRMISVDARYMFWVMDLLDDADHLLREMDVKPHLP
jgi:hypothetical protein